jgi:predicted RNA-binding Zn ribbon-like protein
MRDVEFPLIGEPLVLDLVNTRPNTADGPVDLLDTPAALRMWLAVQADRLVTVGRDEMPTQADLAAVHAVREHAATAIDRARRGERPPSPALRALGAALRAAPAYRTLEWDGDRVLPTPRRDGSLGLRLAAELAESAADLLTNAQTIAAVRMCAGQGCVLLFLPAHPRRRWCSAARCGNRARVARYYQRHRSPLPATQPDPSGQGGPDEPGGIDDAAS